MSRRSKGGIGQRSVRPDVSLTREQLSELMDVDPPNPIPRPQRRRQVLAPAGEYHLGNKNHFSQRLGFCKSFDELAR